MRGNIFSKRNFRYGMVSVIITAVVILFVVLLNSVLTVLFKKYPLNIDLTENRVFEISADTRDFLAALEQDVVIYVMNTEDRFTASSPAEYFVQANEVIRKYAQYSSRIRIVYMDLLRNPDFNSRYPDVSLQVNDILITAGERRRVLTSSELFNIRSSYYGSYVASSKAEQAMTSALLNITRGGTTQIALITGHGEEDVSAFTGLLEMNAYETSEVNLFTGEIPPGASAAILAAPARDLSGEELRKLDAFLAEGDNRVLFYLASLSQPVFPNLGAFLAEWGIEVRQGVAFESDANRLIGNSPYIALADYAEETYSKNMAQKDILPVVPQSRPLGALFEGARYKTVKVLLRLSPGSGIRPPEAPDNWTPSPVQIMGNVPVLLLSSETRNNASGVLVKNHVLVCGSVFAVDA
ncbi:MAG: GldG family protein, partial [Treponema sp.]|nr:GldG family protein [Treponema sp.]